MAYVKQGPWSQGDPLSADQVTAMDQGIYSSSLGAGVGSNLIGDPHFSDSDMQATLWTPDAGWTFSSHSWVMYGNGADSTLLYASSLPAVLDQVYSVRVGIDLTGNSTTGSITISINWKDISDAAVSTSVPIAVTNGNVPATMYQGWAVVPETAVRGSIEITGSSTIPASDMVRITQMEVITVPRPALVVLATADPVPTTLPSGSLIVRS